MHKNDVNLQRRILIMALKQMNIRMDEKLIKRINNHQKNTGKNFTETVRELLEYSLDAKNNSSKNSEKWEKYFKKVAIKNIETNALVQIMLNMVFNPEHSKHSTGKEEAKSLKKYIKDNVINEGLIDDDDEII